MKSSTPNAQLQIQQVHFLSPKLSLFFVFDILKKVSFTTKWKLIKTKNYPQKELF